MKTTMCQLAIFALAFAASFSTALAEPSETSTAKELAEELGSLRNAKVAVAMTEPKRELTYFASSLSAANKAELSKLAPNLRIVTGLNREQALARAEEAHGVDGNYANPDFLNKASNLRWVQVQSAGVDRYLSIDPLMKNDDIVLSNFRGVHGPAIADHAMAMLLSLTRNIKFYTTNQEEGQWRRGKTPQKSIALEGKTMLVVGLGGIGSEIAQRANGFGMRVIGTRRSDSPSPDYIKQVGKPSELLALLPEADVVALAVPLTPETQDLLDAEAFAAMKPGAYLINIARGKVVNTDAMMEALKSGKLAGACLDVTDPEPLPKDHPLWQQANVIITPHIAGNSEVTNQRRSALTVENLRRFAAGEPLLNVVDKVAGY